MNNKQRTNTFGLIVFFFLAAIFAMQRLAAMPMGPRRHGGEADPGVEFTARDRADFERIATEVAIELAGPADRDPGDESPARSVGIDFGVGQASVDHVGTPVMSYAAAYDHFQKILASINTIHNRIDALHAQTCGVEQQVASLAQDQVDRNNWDTSKAEAERTAAYQRSEQDYAKQSRRAKALGELGQVGQRLEVYALIAGQLGTVESMDPYDAARTVADALTSLLSMMAGAEKGRYYELTEQLRLDIV